MTQVQDREYQVDEIVADVARVRIAMVNVYLVGHSRVASRGAAPNSTAARWVLVDAGLPMGAAEILRVAADRFGVEIRPSAIVLTHGHFDHVGALDALLAVWDVPVYAHTAELPFLTGAADYPPPDPTVGTPVRTRLAPPAHEAGIDLGDRVRPLPGNGEVPHLPGWRWIHTPGHTPGHVSLFRASDRLLLAGDALATTDQESMYSGATQRVELCGPPAYLTIDWDKAERSMIALAALRPAVVAAGHGEPITEPSVARALAGLASHFKESVRPTHGRYVVQPALADDDNRESGVPPPRGRRVRWGALSGVAAATFAGTWLYRRFGRR